MDPPPMDDGQVEAQSLPLSSHPPPSHLAAESAEQNEPERPPTKKSAVTRRPQYSVVQRVHVLALHALGHKSQQISSYLKIPYAQVRRIVLKAEQKGYRPQEDPRILDRYVQDDYIRGRPGPGRRPKKNPNDRDAVCDPDPEPLPSNIAEDTI